MKGYKDREKSGGTKYDYFQKKGENSLLSYDDFREKEEGGSSYEMWPYGSSGLRTVAVVSNFNANKYKTNGKYYDYTYKKSKINPDTLQLKTNTKKNVTLYIYNENKMLTNEVNYGKEKDETLYSYDNSGKGSLVVLEIRQVLWEKGK